MKNYFLKPGLISGGFFPLFFFSILFFSFIFNDMQASRQMFVLNADRTTVHYLIIGFGIYLFLYCILNIKKCRFLPKTVIFLFLLAVWIFISDQINNIQFSSVLVRESMSFLWIFVYLFFYIYGNTYANKKVYLNLFVWSMFFSYSGGLLYYSYSIFSSYGRYQVINIIYNIIALLPWIYLLIQKKWYKWLNVAIILLTFVSLKRGAIIAVIALIFVQLAYNNSHLLKKMITSLLVFILLVTAFNIVNSYSSGFLEARFQGDNFSSGSGRTSQYEIAINDIAKRDFFTLTVGKGGNYSNGLIGRSIHNEWLEMLSSYGLVGAVLYLFLFANLLMIKDHCSNGLKIPIIQMMVLCFFLTMLGSMYFAYISIQIFAFFGLLSSKMFTEVKGNENSDSHF